MEYETRLRMKLPLYKFPTLSPSQILMAKKKRRMNTETTLTHNQHGTVSPLLAYRKFSYDLHKFVKERTGT